MGRKKPSNSIEKGWIITKPIINPKIIPVGYFFNISLFIKNYDTRI
jgi:hypothetical protein